MAPICAITWGDRDLTMKYQTNPMTIQAAKRIGQSGPGIGWIGQMVESQAALLAYIDVFRQAALFAALMVPLVLLLLRPVEQKTAPVAH